ncbi:unnamed protein product [Durusdinium trenchii]|uniref:Uncharacterized protein n=1 Tax=Durusdinium trenchii TaxID=1381693 RepID=A0ABP0PKX7_9DINO
MHELWRLCCRASVLVVLSGVSFFKLLPHLNTLGTSGLTGQSGLFLSQPLGSSLEVPREPAPATVEFSVDGAAGPASTVASPPVLAPVSPAAPVAVAPPVLAAAPAPPVPVVSPASPPEELSTPCKRRLAFVLRGQVHRYGRRSQQVASKTHLQAAEDFRRAQFLVDFVLVSRSDHDQGFLQETYGRDAKIAVVYDSECKARGNCYQSRAVIKALELILTSGHSYAFILVTRFDMSFKTELLKTPGLLQSRWAECAQWPVMNHTYWGAWWGGRMEYSSKKFTGPIKQICDTLQLFPAHVARCMIKFLADEPTAYLTSKMPDASGVRTSSYQRCDLDENALEGLMYPGWFDSGIKDQSNPLYEIPGRTVATPGACRGLADFRWLPPPMATYCCSKRPDRHECEGAQRCDKLCNACIKRGECKKWGRKPPQWGCCGKGTLELLPAGRPEELLKGLAPDWWHEPLRRPEERVPPTPAPTPTVPAPVPLDLGRSSESQCSQRIAMVLRGEIGRHAWRDQELCSASHRRAAESLRRAGYEVDIFLAYRKESNLDHVKDLYHPFRASAVIDVAPCAKTTERHIRNCYQSSAGVTATKMILDSGVAYDFVLLLRFDIHLTTDLLQLPGLVQSGFAHCRGDRHTYFLPFLGGRMEVDTRFLGNKFPGSDMLQLYPAHVVPCLYKLMKEHQTSSCNLLRPEYWFRRCDPEGSLGLLLAGWFDEGIKLQSNPLYDIPGRTQLGRCQGFQNFRWLPAPMKAYCCVDKNDRFTCNGKGHCDKLCPVCRNGCAGFGPGHVPEWQCCGPGQLHPVLHQPHQVPQDLPADWWRLSHPDINDSSVQESCGL